MTDKEIKELSTDWLLDARHKIDREINRRKQEPKKRCWKVSLNNGSSATYFKKYEDARKEFLAEMDFTVHETGNKFSIEPIDIPESDYDIRPNEWFGG